MWHPLNTFFKSVVKRNKINLQVKTFNAQALVILGIYLDTSVFSSLVIFLQNRSHADI